MQIDELFVVPTQREEASASLPARTETWAAARNCARVSLQIGHDKRRSRGFYLGGDITPRSRDVLLDKALPAR